MYLRKASRTHKRKTYRNYLLVERRLAPKGPRRTIVCLLGDLSTGALRGDQWREQDQACMEDGRRNTRRFKLPQRARPSLIWSIRASR